MRRRSWLGAARVAAWHRAVGNHAAADRLEAILAAARRCACCGRPADQERGKGGARVCVGAARQFGAA